MDTRDFGGVTSVLPISWVRIYIRNKISDGGKSDLIERIGSGEEEKDCEVMEGSGPPVTYWTKSDNGNFVVWGITPVEPAHLEEGPYDVSEETSDASLLVFTEFTPSRPARRAGVSHVSAPLNSFCSCRDRADLSPQRWAAENSLCCAPA
ncbi:hypothetical protein EVAR_43740_1 [Eumeta japonica]|uniref:Uncharacterized protein n=1 Tax=Eumeta variegata TaxID=151549 RepID=A0A4C1Y3T2_EUMVA|nr:hypothetical protein EVAR_43740_1 [Eumeta japonica]